MLLTQDRQKPNKQGNPAADIGSGSTAHSNSVYLRAGAPLFFNKWHQTIKYLYTETGKIGPIPHTIFKSQSQVYYRPKCEWQNKRNITKEISSNTSNKK